jgi:hypothetical protein
LPQSRCLFAVAATARGDVAPPYPQVSKGWEPAQALLARMSQVYDVRPPSLLKDQSSAYRDGTIFIRTQALDGEVMEAVLAHEFARYLYGHSGFFPAHELEAEVPRVCAAERERPGALLPAFGMVKVSPGQAQITPQPQASHAPPSAMRRRSDSARARFCDSATARL